MKFLHSLFLPAMFLVTVVAAGSCSLFDKDKDTKPPVLTPSEVTLAELEETAIAVTGGKEPYHVSGGNASIASVTVHGNAIDVKALKTGTSIVTVMGDDGATAELTITVTPNGAPVLTPSTVELHEGEVTTVEISDGLAPYRLLGGNALVASVTVNFNTITIKGIKAGDTYVSVTGNDGAASVLTIHVLEGLDREEEERYGEFVPPALEEVLTDKLGMNIYRGTTPPDITGYFLMETWCTRSTIAGDSYVGTMINHYKMNFYDQTGIDVSLEGFEVNSETDKYIAQHDARGTLITGSGNKFSVFFNETIQDNAGPNTINFTVYSGEIVKDNQGKVTGFKNFQFALLMRDNAGRSDKIGNGEGRLFEDDFVEAITKETYERVIKSSGVKSAATGSNLLSVDSK